MINLPPGCTNDDIERNAEGSCPECGRTLRDGVCQRCDSSSCDECGEWNELFDLELVNSRFICTKCREGEEKQC